jgi:EAL domain-containing protein (putative c-di-GMP-specific phosphodiesterase class I)/PleD family two-component response regulator
MHSRSPASAPPLVLTIGDDPHVRPLVREGLTVSGCRIVERTCAESAASFTAGSRPDLVLLDDALADAYALLRELSAEGRAPVLVLTSPDGIERALAAGASDCITTPLHAASLRARVELALRCSRAEREVERLSGPESAGAGPGPSSEAFLSRLDAAIAGARADKGQIAVLHLGVELGSLREQDAIGRRVLDVTLQRFKDSLRSRDMVGRAMSDDATASVTVVGDGEISVVLDALERPQEAYKIARRLQQHLSQPIDVEGAQILLPTSMGIAVHPEDGQRSADLVAAAVAAMQAAREEGKGLIRFARPAMNAVIFERLALETHLRHALERHELIVYYQPRVSIATGEVVSVEALLRWKHPELGMVSPAHFIPVAEESGLILPIGEWVLREACAQNRRWRDTSLPPIRMAVNLSPAQFREPDLMGIVRRALDDAGMPADSLELELTESMLLQKGDATVKTLHTLKAAGVHLSIDDFGTGYSSLNYIKRFPVDALKIDQSFIREMMTSEQDSTLTTSIILMGKGLNLTVVAEGVETRSQLGLLRALGCDQAQGYLFSRPVPADEAGRLIQSGFGGTLSPG